MSAASDDKHTAYSTGNISSLFSVNNAKSTATSQHGGHSRTIPTATNTADAMLNMIGSYITSTAQANYMNAQAAMYATQQSMLEAERNREFQVDMWNQTAAYNSAEARANREWQENMSNTSYQRAMQDMQAAGLNPILAYSQGGAGNGSGAQASIGTLSGAQGSAYSWNNAANGDSMQMIGLMLTAGITALTSIVDKLTGDGDTTAKGAIEKWLKKKANERVKNFDHYGNSSAK